MSKEVNEPAHENPTTLLISLRETPRTISSLIEELSDSEVRWRNSDDEFSVLETICHLRDIEAEGYTTRINRILDETNPVLADIDGGRLAVERKYNDQDPELALRAFEVAREKTWRGYELRILKVLSARARLKA